MSERVSRFRIGLFVIVGVAIIVAALFLFGIRDAFRPTYKFETYTTTTTGARYRATMSQKGDPGYKATSVLLGESGLTLALDRDRLSDLRGVLTPATAMGDALMARFPGAGVLLETARLN